MDDFQRTGGFPKRVVNQDSIKSCFENRIRELSGNHRFQLASLSPDIQVIVRRYLGSKAKDGWEDLGLVDGSPLSKVIIDPRPDPLFGGLFETLQVKRIEQTRKYTNTTNNRSQTHNQKTTNLPLLVAQPKVYFNRDDQSIDFQSTGKKDLATTLPCRKPIQIQQYPMDVDHNKRKYRYVQQSFKEDINLEVEQHTEEKDTKIAKEVKKIVQRATNQRPRQPPAHTLEDMLPIFRDPKFQKDKQFQLKYAAYRELHNVLNLGNNVFVQLMQPLTFSIYKCYVSKGNNGMMVRHILKSRWWWASVENKDELDQINFIWTQAKCVPYLDKLKQLRKKDETASTANNLIPSDSESSESESRLSIKRKSYKTQSQKPIPEEIQKIQNEYAPWKKLISQTDSDILLKITQGKRFLTNDQITQTKKLQIYQDPTQLKYHNHLEHHYHITNKKALFYNMRAYYQTLKLNVFNHLPLTFHLKGPNDTQEWNNLSEAFKQSADEEIQSDKRSKNIWIVKPGENSNRGNGIRVCSTMAEINEIVSQGGTHKNGMPKTFIVQKYMDRPLLYQKRKFDIRCFLVISCINGHMRGYWYQEGYVRTSSKEFSTKNLQNRMIHLTNDAVQKKSDNYGRFEKGNKVSFEEFQRYVHQTYQTDFMGDMYPQMRHLARDIVKAAYLKVDPDRRENTFELFGLDYMIDDHFKVWLIEVNTNPCLETTSPILNRIIPTMVDNVFKVVLDPLYPPPPFFSQKKMVHDNVLETNRLELIFDESDDGPALIRLFDQNEDPLIGEILEESEEELENPDDD